MDDVRRRGRPRDAGADEAILEAARELLLRDGYAGLSMEKVAAVAGVGKPTLYRRWSSRAALAGDVVQHVFRKAVPDAAVDEGRYASAAEQLTALYNGFASMAGDPHSAALVLALTAAAAENPDDAESLYRHHTKVLHEAIANCVRRGMRGGEFGADGEPDSVADALIGSVLYGLLTGPGTFSPERGEGLLAILLAGLRTGRFGSNP
ncbi:TetR/AcrR family transcriptional regulator [Streptomyces sp. NPDC059894]|uniref:TetR/AcrR family transcriptional regulator n=1 Tax=unclassified Streptomyces TaxID=2593676 RepID=UPI00365571A5